MTVAEQVKQDMLAAMRAADKPRVAALRLLLSELQKAQKDGRDDETAVLRREHKRRVEAADTFAENGRSELASRERAEAELIAGYLPQQLSDAELAELVRAAVADTGAAGPRDMGRVIKHVLAAAGDRADGKRVSALAREALQ